MNTIMTAMQCDAIIHEFSEKATRVKEINSFLCLLKNGIFHLSVFDTHAPGLSALVLRNGGTYEYQIWTAKSCDDTDEIEVLIFYVF